MSAFRKIYTALYSAQTSFLKKKEILYLVKMTVAFKQSQDYTYQNSNTRSVIAWELAELYYKNVSSSNTELLKSIFS